jgi:hypothetical protein
LRSTINLFLILFAVLVCFQYCRKKELINDQSSKTEWLNYNGNNEIVKSIVAQLKSADQSAKLVSECSSCSPAWDQFIFSGRPGDSLAHMLIPVINQQGTSEEYIALLLDKSKLVKNVTVFNYEKDYINNKDPYTKAMSGIDFIALKKAGANVPSGVSVDSVKKLLATACQSRTSKPEKKIAGQSLKTLAETTCLGYITGGFTYNPTDICEVTAMQAIYRIYLIQELDAVVSQTGGSYSVGNENGGYVVSGSPDLISNLNIIATAAWNQTYQQLSPSCAVFLTYLDVNVVCTPDGSGGGSGPGADPCIQKNDVTIRFNDNSSQYNTILGHLGTSNYEYGTEQVLANLGDVTSYLSVPVRTDGSPDSFTGNFSWNSNSGYTIGFVHSHPSGSPPSPADVFEMLDHLTFPDLANSSQANKDFYINNASVTVITSSTTYVLTVKDLSVFTDAYNAFQSNPVGFQDTLDYYTSFYGSSTKGFLRVFAGAINVYMTGANSSDFIPVILTPESQLGTPCN